MVRLFVHFIYICTRRSCVYVYMCVYHLGSRVDKVSIDCPHDTCTCESRGAATAALHDFVSQLQGDIPIQYPN